MKNSQLHYQLPYQPPVRPGALEVPADTMCSMALEEKQQDEATYTTQEARGHNSTRN